jgi:hypothetical protein
MSSPNESPRIAALRLDLATRLSSLSSNPTVPEDMKRQPLASLLAAYVHWAIRSVAKRPRRVIVKQPDDPHWKKIAAKAAPFLKLAEEGGDVMSHVCLAPHMRDFAVPGGAYGEWRDKDIVLAIMGYHFFQCEPRDKQRTGSHILAYVDRSTLTAVGAFQGNSVNTDPAESMRIWNLIQAYGTAPVDPRHLMRISAEFLQKIAELDPKLDDPQFVRQLHEETGNVLPPAPKFRWHMPYLDFGILEETAPRFFMVWPGPN